MPSRSRQSAGRLSDTIARAERAAASGALLIRAERLAWGAMQGRHATRSRGASQEFYDFRAHATGESASTIDWKVFARTDRSYVRTFRQEARARIVLVVDLSASMSFRGWTDGGVSKAWRAKELAAACALIAAAQGDQIGAVVAGDTEPLHLDPAAGQARAMHIVGALERAPVAGDSGLAPGLRLARTIAGRSGVIIALSDCLDDARTILSATAEAVEPGGAQRRLILIQTLRSEEIRGIGPGRAARLVDPETDQWSAGDDARIAEAAERVRAHLDEIRRGVQRLGGRCALHLVDVEDPMHALAEALIAARP